MKDKKAFNKIIKARASLVIRHPFFASLALRLNVREDYSCRTAWTDGKIFAYNPHYVNILSSEKLEGMAAHVVMHPACNHHRRRQKRDHKTWNKACDYAINWILLDADLTLPDGYLYLDEYRGKTAESVYEILCQGKNDEEPDETRQDINEDDKPDQENSDNDAEQTAGDNEGAEPDDEPTPDGDPGLSGEIRDDPGGSGVGDGAGDEVDWDEAVIQAAVNARGMGKLPAGLELFVENKGCPRLCWQELLARFIEKSARSDYSWLTPNRRYIHLGLYFPSLKNSELNEIVIAVDTSGSITPAELAGFAAEISGIMEQYPATVHLLYCDAKVARHDTFQRCDLPIEIKPEGGGGTDYRPVFTYIDQAGITPACLLYLTDMECNRFPDSPPYYPLLWVKTGGSSREPPFGEAVLMD